MKRWLMWSGCGLGLGLLTALSLAAPPVKFGEIPAENRQAAKQIQQLLDREPENPAERKQLLLDGVAEIRATLPADHYSRTMLPTTADSVEQLESRLHEVRESLMFQPLQEAETPRGFPSWTPLHHIQVKQYPAYRMAQTTMTGRGEGGAFNTLFNHIQNNDIAMTAPVQMDYHGSRRELEAANMAFLYGNTEIGKPGTAGDVQVVDVPSMQAVTIGLRGDMKPAAIQAAVEKLRTWLETDGDQYTADGSPRVMGYNSPFIPNSLRYYEVQIPVRERE